VPADSVLNSSVRDALEGTKKAQNYLRKSTKEWESDKKQEFISALPASLRHFIDTKLPMTLLDYYDQAFVIALKRKAELSGILAPLMENVRAI